MKPPSSARIAWLAIAFNAMLWLVFAVGTAIGVHPSYRDLGLLRWAMATLATITATILLLLAHSLAKRGKLAYWLATGFLAVIVLAALFDELGLADLIFIILTSIPIILLLRSRSWYLQPHQQPPQGPPPNNSMEPTRPAATNRV